MINNKAAELARVRRSHPLWSVCRAEPDGFTAERAGFADIYDDTLAGLAGQLSTAEKHGPPLRLTLGRQGK